MITQAELKEILNYCPQSGEFRWKITRGSARSGAIAGSICGQGYGQIHFGGKTYKAHRLAWLYTFGVIPSLQVDHINHIRNDNRIANLREVTHSENHRNLSMYRRNKSGCTGVTWHKRDCKWQSRIIVNCKIIFLGYFERLEDAVAARKDANIKYEFHKNHGKENKA